MLLDKAKVNAVRTSNLTQNIENLESKKSNLFRSKSEECASCGPSLKKIYRVKSHDDAEHRPNTINLYFLLHTQSIQLTLSLHADCKIRTYSNFCVAFTLHVCTIFTQIYCRKDTLDRGTTSVSVNACLVPDMAQ